MFSIVLASVDLTHSKETVTAYIDIILNRLPPTVNKLSIWSDGPASQFKNRYIFASLKALSEKHNGINITWNFFVMAEVQWMVLEELQNGKCEAWLRAGVH